VIGDDDGRTIAGGAPDGVGEEEKFDVDDVARTDEHVRLAVEPG